MDALDALAIGGLVLIGIGLTLGGYPLGLAGVGAVLFAMGIWPHVKGRK